MADEYCVNVKMSYLDNCRYLRAVEEKEFCGDKAGDEAIDWRDAGSLAGRKLEAMDRYFKDEAGNKRYVSNPPPWCGWIAFEGNCWNRSSVFEEPRTIEDENSICFERTVVGFFETSKEYVCHAKNED